MDHAKALATARERHGRPFGQRPLYGSVENRRPLESRAFAGPYCPFPRRAVAPRQASHE